jgi:hypothetical protein
MIIHEIEEDWQRTQHIKMCIIYIVLFEDLLLNTIQQA